MIAPLTHDHDLSPEAVELLRRGVESDGIVCRPGEIRKLYPLLHEAERLGYVRFLDVERPWLTEAGRAAIGAPSQAESDRARLVLLCGGALMQVVPTDDQIIVGHMRDAHALLLAERRERRSLPLTSPQSGDAT